MIFLEDKKTRMKRHLLLMLVNTVILLDVLLVAWNGITHGAGSGQVGNYVIGLGYLKPYTMDSNILSAIVALMILVCGTLNLIRGSDNWPKWLETLNLMSSACLFLTFTIAALFLGPMKALMGESYFSMFSDDMFFFHFLNPVFAGISFTLLYREHRFRKRTVFIAGIPTYIYTVVYLVMVVILKKWEDFYNFTLGGQYFMVPIVIIVINSLVLGLSLLLIRAHNKNLEN